MRLNQDKIQRMIDGRGGVAGGGSSIDPGMIAGLATEAWTEENYVSKTFFNELFVIHKKTTTTVYDGTTVVSTTVDTSGTFAPNEIPSEEESTDSETGYRTVVVTEVDNIEAKKGLWTDFFLSALGLNAGGGGGGIGDVTWQALGDQLDDRQIASSHLTTALNNALVGYATQSWVTSQNYVTSSAISDMATKTWVNNQSFVNWTALGDTTTTQQIALSHLTTALSTYATQSWVTNNFSTPSTVATQLQTYAKIQNGTITIGDTSLTPITSVTGTFWGKSWTNGGTVNGTIKAGANGGAIEQFGSIELNSAGTLAGYGGFIDFHYYATGTTFDSTLDYTSRIIESSVGVISILAKDNNATNANRLAGLLVGDGFDGSYVQIGSIRIVYDSTNNALKVVKIVSGSEVAANFYATGSVSALGYGSGGGGGTGDVTWTTLADNTDTRQIALSHLTGALAGYATTSQLAGYLPLTGGTMTGDTYIHNEVAIEWSPASGFIHYQRMPFRIKGGSYFVGVNLYNSQGVVYTKFGIFTDKYSQGNDANCIICYPNAAPKIGTNVIWNAGNDGSGSGLDADLLDGLNSDSFLSRQSGSNKYISNTNANNLTFGIGFNATEDGTGNENFPRGNGIIMTIEPNFQSYYKAQLHFNTDNTISYRYGVETNWKNWVGLVVANGTSSQFIKGDGSLDSSSYLPLTGGTLVGNTYIHNDVAIEWSPASGFNTYIRMPFRIHDDTYYTGINLMNSGGVVYTKFGIFTGNTALYAQGNDANCIFCYPDSLPKIGSNEIITTASLSTELANYLPLTGGTLSTSSMTPLICNSTSGIQSCILLQLGGTTNGQFGYTPGDGVYLYRYATTGEYIGIKGLVAPYYKNGSTEYKILHEGYIRNTNFDSSSTVSIKGSGNTGQYLRFGDGLFISDKDKLYSLEIKCESDYSYIYSNASAKHLILQHGTGDTTIYGNVGIAKKDPSYRLDVNGSIRGDSFIRLNGTSAQFLKADGSVDSTAYTTNTGTVTSVAMTTPTGLSVSGSPITTSGTLALTFASGYSIPTTASQTNWDTAYGWGNHATAGYLLKSGGTMTGDILMTNEVAIEWTTTYGGFFRMPFRIKNGNYFTGHNFYNSGGVVYTKLGVFTNKYGEGNDAYSIFCYPNSAPKIGSNTIFTSAGGTISGAVTITGVTTLGSNVVSGTSGGAIEGFHSWELNTHNTAGTNIGGFLDFHYNGTAQDYSVRLIEKDYSGVLQILAKDTGTGNAQRAGLIVGAGTYTSFIQIGNGRIVWNDGDHALRIVDKDGNACNLYATGGISALGYQSGGGGGGSTGVFSTSITPDTTGVYDLGTSTYKWRNLYLAGANGGNGFSIITSYSSYVYIGSLNKILFGADVEFEDTAYVENRMGIGVKNGNYDLYVYGENEGNAYFAGDVSVASLTNRSDMRLKDVVGDVNLSVQQIASAPAFKFRFKEKAKRTMVGTSAQYWDAVLPESVTRDADGILGLDYGVTALVSTIILAKGMTEHERRITKLEKENAELRARIKDLEEN